MPLFLTILEGPSPSEATPLLATSDPRLIALVARELAARLGPEPVPLSIVPLVQKKEKVRNPASAPLDPGPPGHTPEGR